MRYIYCPNCATFIPETEIEQLIRKRDGSGWEVWTKGSNYDNGDDWEPCEAKFYKNPFNGV